MPAPKPLTQCPPPALDWSRPSAPASTDFDDIYFSTDGGLEEAETVFLKGCGLPEGWQKHSRFVIGELGFGSGLNFLTAWRMWDKTKTANSRLHFISIEKFPFDAEQLRQALAAWPELENYSAQLIDQWPGRVKGFHRLHFGDVTLTLIHDDISGALDAVDARVEAWFLDGFTPVKNPDMWSSEVMAKIARLSAPGARLGTFTVAANVRQALIEAGFEVEKKDGFGRKRHRLEARFPGTPHKENPIATPVIIGAGIAGASLVKAFARRGITPILYHDPAQPAASHNPAALIKPRLDLQDRPESRFFLASYLYALSAYKDFALMEGITHIPKSDEEIARFEKLNHQAPLPPEHLSFEPQNKALTLGKSLVIPPQDILKDWLGPCKPIENKFDMAAPRKAPALLAIGYGIKDTLGETMPNLRFSRGQLTWAKPLSGIPRPLAYGGYALPLDAGLLLGTTHQPVTRDDPFEAADADDLENLAGLEIAAGVKAVKSDKPSRASVRVNTANTLPVVGEIDTNLWLLTGLGSRGFVFAPLLAEAIVSKICGDPLPISKQTWERFGLREK